MENFKEIAEKCLKGELAGRFKLRSGLEISSYNLRKSEYTTSVFQYKLLIPYWGYELYTEFGCYSTSGKSNRDIINFIPDKDMETKEIKIEVPEGYEIDKENSSFEKIIFKKKETKYPESWKDCTYGFSIGFKTRFIPSNPSKFIGNLMEKTSAYTKLLCLRQEWIHIWSKEQGMEKDWEPDWNSGENKACIACYHDEPDVDSWQSTTFSLSFPTYELANRFLNNFKDLLEQAKGLY